MRTKWSLGLDRLHFTYHWKKVKVKESKRGKVRTETGRRVIKFERKQQQQNTERILG